MTGVTCGRLTLSLVGFFFAGRVLFGSSVWCNSSSKRLVVKLGCE